MVLSFQIQNVFEIAKYQISYAKSICSQLLHRILFKQTTSIFADLQITQSLCMDITSEIGFTTVYS